LSLRVQRLCAWSGVATVVVTFAGWLIAGVLPLPLGPSDAASEVVAFYAGHQTRLLIGLVVATLGIALVMPLFAVVAVHMLRIEGRFPVLTFLQLIAGAATTVLLLMPLLLMAVIGFAPGRPVELTVAMNDIAWLLFITPIAPFIIQNLAMGGAILTDRRGVFPRWAGYLNLWVAFAFVPDVLAYFFHAGPFGWNGVFVFWLALTAYAVFLVAMGIAVRPAIASAQASVSPRDDRVPDPV
jgi:hypothetical protein